MNQKCKIFSHKISPVNYLTAANANVYIVQSPLLTSTPTVFSVSGLVQCTVHNKNGTGFQETSVYLSTQLHNPFSYTLFHSQNTAYQTKFIICNNTDTIPQYTTLYYSKSKTATFWLHEAAIPRLYVSDCKKNENYIAVAIHLKVKTYGQDQSL